MGMAASQARLLAITARIHDVEYQAQSLQNAKLQLATQSDRAYSEYLEALDATTMTISCLDPTNGGKSSVIANFNTLCSINKVTPSVNVDYALTDSKNRLIVSDDIYQKYQQFQAEGFEQNPYFFAMYMLGELDELKVNGSRELEEEIYKAVLDSEDDETLKRLHEKLEDLTKCNDTPGNTIYDNDDILNGNDKELKKEYEDTLAAYQKHLYENYSNKVYAKLTEGKGADELNNDKFNYYASIFKQIQAVGDCVSISEFDGTNGDAANNSEWLHNMVRAGQITIHTVDTNKTTGKVKLDGASPSSDIALEYAETTSIDKVALAKAEAKYEKSLKEIDQKDKRFDLSLSKLEAERTALTTEYDSVKKVIEDNIDRTFKIFS